jgi:hypothetical protein
MSDLEMWSAVVAFFLPLVIAVAQRPSLSGTARVVIMVVFCAIAALVTTWLQGDLNWSRWFHSLLIVTIATIAFYRGMWKQTGTTHQVEKATSPRR